MKTETKVKPEMKKTSFMPLTAMDEFLFNEGNHLELYKKLGAHTLPEGKGTYFAVWAPDAEYVSVIGSFNYWNRHEHALSPKGCSGIWEGKVPQAKENDLYKFFIRSRNGAGEKEKTDPFAFSTEIPPKTASVITNLDYGWSDQDWMATRKEKNSLEGPISIYEVHLGSWMRIPEEGYRSLNYREIAHRLAEHVKNMGFTHVELLPIMEHPFYGSWGYQTTQYFAPSRRFGTPQDFKYFVDHLHQEGIGIILDWVPSHFPNDDYALADFDGTCLFEHQDPKKGYHPDWKSLIFNFNRNEVRAFLISSALYWLEEYHIDGIRVDAVASMIYLDYSRKEGEWIPNKFGGNENLEAIDFIKQLNEAVYSRFPDVQTFAEESTAWTKVSRPTYDGGLGFGMKWDMGWMHDTLQYMMKDPVHRKFHHSELTFRMLYAFNENFVLSLSHDEVVHGKSSLLGKMPGDDWQKFANLRLLYGYMFGQPGKKLLFMGSEFGQWNEWNHDGSLDWHLVGFDRHQGVLKFLQALHEVYRGESALHKYDFDGRGFEWIDGGNSDQSILSFLRKGQDDRDLVQVVCNFTPVFYPNYRMGVPRGGFWREILNSDDEKFWGGGKVNSHDLVAENYPLHGREHTISLNLPPLGVSFLKWEGYAKAAS